MKVFLKKITLFSAITLLGFCLAIIVIIYLNRKLVEKCDLNNYTRSLILGDSHTMWAISDENIDSLQNISWNAESYIYTFAKLRYLLNNEPNISEIFLGFSYHNLSSFYDSYTYGHNMGHLLYRYIGVLSNKEIIEIIGNSSNGLKLLRVVLKYGLKAILINDCVIYPQDAFNPMKETFNMEQMEKRIQEQYYHKTEVIDTSAINIKYLNKIIDLCLEKNIKLVMLSLIHI